MRQNISSVDLSAVLPEEVEEEVREAAEISMGTEVRILAWHVGNLMTSVTLCLYVNIIILYFY